MNKTVVPFRNWSRMRARGRARFLSSTVILVYYHRREPPRPFTFGAVIVGSILPLSLVPLSSARVNTATLSTDFRYFSIVGNLSPAKGE